MMRPQYRFIKEVGRGASGSAQLMEDSQGTHYIMKSIQTDNMKENQLRNAINEIKILNELRHPFIVRYRESFIENGALNIIMDFCAGGDMAKRITHQRKEVKKKFKQSEVVCWLAQAVMALSDMHKRRIMHRDLKPLNIFLDCADDRIRLGDFGISKQLDCTEGVAHTFVGTPHYMSPEVVKGSKAGYGSAADIWSLGCVLYELCTFKTPYHNAYPMTALIEALLDSKPVAPIPAGYYSSELISLCDSMLQKDPKKRPTHQDLLRAPLVQSGILAMLASPTFHGCPQGPSPFAHPAPPPALPMQSLPKLVVPASSPGGRLTDSTASTEGGEQKRDRHDRKGLPVSERKKDDEEKDSVICYRTLQAASLEGMPEELKKGGRKKAEGKGRSEGSSNRSGSRKEAKDDNKENERSSNSGNRQGNSSGSRSKPTEERTKQDDQKPHISRDTSQRNNNSKVANDSMTSEGASYVVQPQPDLLGKRRNVVLVETALAADHQSKQHARSPAEQAGGEKKKSEERRRKGKEGEDDGQKGGEGGKHRHHSRPSDKDNRKDDRHKS
eukprot:GHVS01056929.1.p1 GENE.GHVS01056929.1~~GHVS01056929.1.p1  ORF type:complete len:556 (-),score=97.49 GHVS01056929.1:558-2225(-)